MGLGVLNNISALYAENALNNTNNSLQNVLTQLSSGSKINSGSDDAAGLSLIDGLQANATALTSRQPTLPKARAFCRWLMELFRK